MTSEQRHKSRLLWIIVGGISVVVLLFLVAQWFFNSSTNKTSSTSSQATPASSVTSVAPASMPVAASAASEAEANTLVDATILKAEVPKNPSLAKEELAKLDDIHAQLKDQEATLKAQQQDADNLIKLKTEQIKLLEQQLAEQK